MARRQASGMGMKRGEPVRRAEVRLPPCRGCGVALTDETLRWDDERATFVCVPCGIADPVGGR